jgi:ABC-2 type transport system permease protein
MNGPQGLGFLLHTMGRAQRRRLVVWVLALVGSLAFTAISVARLYDTPAKIQTYGEAVVSDALVAINGRVEGIDSLGGIIQDEFGFLASFLMPLVGIALVASMTRAEEESGRLEALLSGRIDRRAPVVAALVLVLAAVAAMDLGFVVSLLVAGVDLGPAALYALSLGMLSLVFAALAAVCAQVVLHSRGVYACGFVVVGLSYLLRGIGDVRDTFWVWLSPLGWVEKTAPFADDQRWWVLLIPLVVTAGLSAVAIALAGRRDLGAALYRQGPGAEAAPDWLVRPIGLAVHGQQASFLAWLVGSLALAAVMGGLAQELVDAVLGNSSLSKATGITSDNAADGYLAFTQVYLALIACGYLVQALGTLRHDETAGRLEPMLAGTIGRGRWLGVQLLVVSLCLVLMVTGSALALSATTALSTGGSGHTGTLMKAGLAYVPAELVIAGVAVLLFGFAPRAFALAWATFGAVTFIGLLGSGLQLPQWLLDLSPLTHVGNPPVGDIDTSALAWLTVVALGLTATAFAAFRQRRVPQH